MPTSHPHDYRGHWKPRATHRPQERYALAEPPDDEGAADLEDDADDERPPS